MELCGLSGGTHQRHGNQVTVTKCENEDEMLAETEKNIRGWMKEGRETIAVICRDEEAAAMVSARLGEKLPLADSDPETASFTRDHGTPG